MSMADFGPARRAPARKDTRRWCRGKVGREHTPECEPRRFKPGGRVWLYVYACTSCGKHLDAWYAIAYRRRTPPSWVKVEPEP